MTLPATPTLPCTAGIGLRAVHYHELLQQLPAIDWLEVHSENFFGGGAALNTLRRVREHYPISLHGVGLGLASPPPLDQQHLAALKKLCDEIEPAAVSEHLCWNSADGRVINDLLPFPYTQAALTHVAERVEQVQALLGRQLLIENLSSYLTFNQSEMGEAEFLAALSRRTGCGILFDVNNLFVNQCNLGMDALAFIKTLPADAVAEYHLAGATKHDGCWVDTHSTAVSNEVWALYEIALQQIGPRPTLIEWDNDIPELALLLNEATKAQQQMGRFNETLV